MSNSILFVEDDFLFAQTLVDLLEEEGYSVTHCANGQDALDATFESRFDLYLLDINLPLLKGTKLLEELRLSDDFTPAMFLTSHKEKSMLLEGFKSGADDFLVKPFDLDELLMRLRSLLRRKQPQGVLRIGKLTHEPFHKRVLYADVPLDLSKKEYELLVILMNNKDAPVTKEHILETLWQHGEGGSDGAIRVYINRLKQLLPEMSIENIRGIGYRLVS